MLLELDGFGITHQGAPLLQGVELRLDRGQRLGIIGEPGSGKSLLVKALTGLLPSGMETVGKALFDGHRLPVTARDWLAIRRRRIALLRHAGAASLPLGQRVGEFVTDRALLDDLALDPLQRIGALAPSEKQALLIAEAVGRKPDLFVLDDAFTELDAPAEKRVIDLLLAQSAALLVTGQDFPAIAALTRELIILEQGRIVERGDTPTLFSRPMNDYSRQLISSRRVRARTLMRSPIGTPLLEVQVVSASPRNTTGLLGRARPGAGLDDISFVVRRGEALAVVGAAGSGKTTLARVISGLDRAQKGRVVFEQHNAYRGRPMPRPLRAEISMVFSDPRTAFDGRLDLGAAIAQPLLLDEHHTIEEQTDRLLEVINGVGLMPEHLQLRPADLSLYELQLAALARALVNRPRLVVLDEPVRLLHAGQRNEMLTLINRVRADFGFTAILTAASLELVRPIADRALILDNGRIVEEGMPGELLDNPVEPATRALARARLPEVGLGVVAPVGR